MNQNGQTALRQPTTTIMEQVAVPTASQATLEQILAATEDRKTNSVMEQARIGFRSKYLPKHIQNEDQAIAIALAGAELGIAPMTAFRQIYFFDGRVVLSAALLVALAHRRVEGFRIDIVKATEAGCWVAVWRPGMTEPAKISFTLDDAVRAGLTGKDNWRKYPASMCIARAQSMAVRAVAPEAALGILTEEEKQDGVRFEVDVTADGLQVTPQAPQASPVDALKQQLRQQQTAAPAAATPIDKKAQRAAPPAGFGSDDPSAPPAGFPAPKKKGKDEPKAKDATLKDEPKPVDPLDCSKRKEGDVFEARGQRWIVRSTAVGLVPELLEEATQDSAPEYEPGSEG